MNVFKIALRSVQHRGLGSVLTIFSMALGVMMVVTVLSIHGVVSQSFKNNSSFGYNILVGARGGGLQLTLNTVYYLSQPVENVPYEYYLAFCDKPTRNRELKNSLAFAAYSLESDTRQLATRSLPGGGGLGGALADQVSMLAFEKQQAQAMGLEKSGLYEPYTHIAVPLCMGDYYVDPATQAGFRCVGTKPHFFTDLVLNVETQKKFGLQEGRYFEECSDKHGFFECVLGSATAKRTGLKLGDRINLTHGVPESEGAHIHDETDYTVVGILEHTGTPHDRVVFVNMEGFFLMVGHDKNIEDERQLKGNDAEPSVELDPFADENEDENSELDEPVDSTIDSEAESSLDLDSRLDVETPLPIEQREVTSILVRTSLNDEFDMIALYLVPQINEGDLETTLDWSPYRPARAQKAAQAVNPIQEVTSLFQLFVDPIRWVLLALTSLICIVSGVSILVGIYNSMSQRQHEIAVMRALGAGRLKVMNIMLCESILLAVAGGMLGWVAGHSLNAILSPMIEARTGVQVGFIDLAPGIPLGQYPGGSLLPGWLVKLPVSPELLLIPGMMLLGVMVGVYPAISAYRTDVSGSLGK